MRSIPARPARLCALLALAGCGLAACGGGGDGVPTVDPTATLTIDLQARVGQTLALPPLQVNGGATIDSAAIWLYGVTVVSDLGAPAHPQIEEVPYVIGKADPKMVISGATTGLYSLAQIELAPPDAEVTIPDDGFAGQRLAMRVTGRLGDGRSFVISDADTSRIAMRAVTPLTLEPGAQMLVMLECDLAGWLDQIDFSQLQAAAAGQPIAIGPTANLPALAQFRANVIASFGLALH